MIIRVVVREDVRMEAEVREEGRCYAASFEDEGRGHILRDAGGL